MSGLELLRVLIESSGLPPESIESELKRLIVNRGLTPENLTMDDIREILAAYLQDTLMEAKGNV